MGRGLLRRRFLLPSNTWFFCFETAIATHGAPQLVCFGILYVFSLAWRLRPAAYCAGIFWATSRSHWETNTWTTFGQTGVLGWAFVVPLFSYSARLVKYGSTHAVHRPHTSFPLCILNLCVFFEGIFVCSQSDYHP